LRLSTLAAFIRILLPPLIRLLLIKLFEDVIVRIPVEVSTPSVLSILPDVEVRVSFPVVFIPPAILPFASVI